MNKYFFDRVYRNHSEYDYCGRELPSQEAARQLAELIAIDLEVIDEGTWCGWAIMVRDALGKQCVSVPVRSFAADLCVA